MAKKDATVLAIDDRDDPRTTLVSRIYVAEVGAVVAPATFQELVGNLTTRNEPYSLIILDYDLEGWGFNTVEPVLTELRSHPASKDTPLVVLTGHYRYAIHNPLLSGVEIVDSTIAGTDGVREIIEKYIE